MTSLRQPSELVQKQCWTDTFNQSGNFNPSHYKIKEHIMYTKDSYTNRGKDCAPPPSLLPLESLKFCKGVLNFIILPLLSLLILFY